MLLFSIAIKLADVFNSKPVRDNESILGLVTSG